MLKVGLLKDDAFIELIKKYQKLESLKSHCEVWIDDLRDAYLTVSGDEMFEDVDWRSCLKSVLVSLESGWFNDDFYIEYINQSVVTEMCKELTGLINTGSDWMDHTVFIAKKIRDCMNSVNEVLEILNLDKGLRCIR